MRKKYELQWRATGSNATRSEYYGAKQADIAMAPDRGPFASRRAADKACRAANARAENMPCGVYFRVVVAQ